MKMKYQKPMVAVDRYELSQSIAGCNIKVGSTSGMCFLKDPDVPNSMKSFAYYGWFADDACTYRVIAGNNYDGFCYHTQANSALTS